MTYEKAGALRPPHSSAHTACYKSSEKGFTGVKVLISLYKEGAKNEEHCIYLKNEESMGATLERLLS